jgi:hypothetical protein
MSLNIKALVVPRLDKRFIALGIIIKLDISLSVW